MPKGKFTEHKNAMEATVCSTIPPFNSAPFPVGLPEATMLDVELYFIPTKHSDLDSNAYERELGQASERVVITSGQLGIIWVGPHQTRPGNDHHAKAAARFVQESCHRNLTEVKQIFILVGASGRRMCGVHLGREKRIIERKCAHVAVNRVAVTRTFQLSIFLSSEHLRSSLEFGGSNYIWTVLGIFLSSSDGLLLLPTPFPNPHSPPTMSAPTTTKQLLVQSRHWILALAAVQAVVCVFILQSRFWDSASGARAPGMLEVLSPDSMTLYTTLSAKDAMSIFWRDGVTEMVKWGKLS
ncbi:hypothetical protein K438DRAFT_1764504 [Mycena galopus ATCC 62051]|nr:hypothetical protein K438DRAFT_1764504 [Mycena galopus ATCC 62051]